jgi:hypothetical protein
MTELQFPWRRTEIAAFLQDLANPLYQWEAWIEGKHGQTFGFSSAADLMLDDLQVYDDAQGCLGLFLKTQEEVDTMYNLSKAMIAVIDATPKASDKERITHPLWADVLAAAREALDAFTRAEYGYPLKP